MRFRRKSAPSEPEPAEALDPEATADEDRAVEEGAQPTPDGPYDLDEAPEGLVDDSWIDLGSLVLAPAPGKELRLQLDEASGTVASVMLLAEDGAVELRAFAAPRNGDLWAESLPALRADVAQRGGVTKDREGPWGAELLCQIRVQTPDGENRVQPSRIVGINGSRWMLRATFLGRPAIDVDQSGDWEELLTKLVVRRGQDAMPKGQALFLRLPPNAERVDGPNDEGIGEE